MKNIILLLMILISSFRIYGQDIKFSKKFSKIEKKNFSTLDQKKEYEKLFDEEFEKQTQRNLQHIYDIIPERIPEWFFSSHPNSRNTYFAIGISDPSMKEEKAIQQASIRARAIITLLNNCEFKNITDDYTNLEESNKFSEYATKFQDFAKANAVLNFNNKKTKIVSTFFTKYNEAIVLLKVQVNNKQKNTTTTSVVSEHLQIFIENETGVEKIEFFNFKIKEFNNQTDSINNLKYSYRKINTEFEINSQWNDRKYELPDRSFNYRNISDTEIEIDSLNIISNKCNKGLWNAYVSTLLSNMTFVSKNFPGNIKSSNDNYNSSNQDLIRIISKNKLQFNIDNTKIKNNNLYQKTSAIRIKKN